MKKFRDGFSVKKYDSDDGKIFFLGNSCDSCILRPKRYFTIQDIWNTFGYDYDIKTELKILPTLNLGILERLAIAIALKQTNFSQKKASVLLNISQRALNYFVDDNKITSDKYSKNAPIPGEKSTQELFDEGINLFEWAKGNIVLCEEIESEIEN